MKHDQLLQLLTATWDGNLISKQDRDKLIKAGFAVRGSGFNVITPEGLQFLDEQNLLKR